MSSIGENVDDRLSRLPEDILSHILSLMPTKFAVQTSILSKRWRYIWMFVTNLDFDVTPHNHAFNGFSENFVGLVLEFCKTSKLQSVRLRSYDEVLMNPRVPCWIDKIVSLNVCELDIQLRLSVLPLSMLTCKTLTTLRLDVSACKYSVCECLSPVDLPCMKNLDIVVYTNPFENAFKLISGCTVLESLSLEVKWYDHGGDYIFNIPTLKRLRLNLLKCGYAVNRVVLRVPNLEYLFVGGMLGSFYVMEDFPPLVEALVSFDCLVSSEYTILDLWGEFLKGISEVKSLSIQEFLMSSPLPTFPNMKRLNLNSLWHFGEILKSCPALEHLCIEKVEDSWWTQPKMLPACMLTNLTTIKFSSHKWQKCDMELLKYMLGNAAVLKTVTATWENLGVEEERRLCAKLIKLPRASRYCEIHFTGMIANQVAKDGRSQRR